MHSIGKADTRTRAPQTTQERLSRLAPALLLAIGTLAACAPSEASDDNRPIITATAEATPDATAEAIPDATAEATPDEIPTETVDVITFPDISEMPGSSPTEAYIPFLFSYEKLTKYPNLDEFNNLDSQAKREHAAMLIADILWTKGNVFTQDPKFELFTNPLNATPDDSGEEILKQWKSGLASAGSQATIGENERVFNATLATEALTLAFVNVGNNEATDVANYIVNMYQEKDGSLTTLGAANYGLATVNKEGYTLEFVSSGKTQATTNGEGITTYSITIEVRGSDGAVIDLTFVLTDCPIAIVDDTGNIQYGNTWQLAEAMKTN